MDYTMIIAIIGCVTGAASLIIEAAQYFSGKSRLKLDTFDELNNFIYFGKDSFDENVIHCFLNLRAINTGGKYSIIQDVYMRRPGYGKKGKDGKSGVIYPYGVFSATPWKYCNGCEMENPPKIHMPASIPEGNVFEAVFAFTDIDDECYKTEESFLHPVLCVVLADGTVRELPVQAIMQGEHEFNFVNSVEDKRYSMKPGDIYEDAADEPQDRGLPKAGIGSETGASSTDGAADGAYGADEYDE